MEYLIIIALWVLYCIQQGWNDARHFAHGAGHYIKQQTDKYNYNIHTSLLIGRIIVFFVFLFSGFKLGGSVVNMVPLGIGLAALFPFFHEGAYYSTRKRMDNPNGYPKSHLALWFNYKSPTSTAKINYPGWVRAVVLFGGIFALLTLLK